MRRDVIIQAIDNVINSLVAANVREIFMRGRPDKPEATRHYFESYASLKASAITFGEAENFILKTFDIEKLYNVELWDKMTGRESKEPIEMWLIPLSQVPLNMVWRPE
jgi:hypothetical protein